MRLSTSSLHYRSLPLVEACRRIGDLRFQGVDVWSHFEWAGPLCEHLEEGLEKLGVDKFAALLRQHELQLFAASCYSAPSRRFVPLLGRLGGCVIIRGSRAAQGSATELTPGELKKQIANFLESLKPELELAEQHRCVLAIENHSGKSLLNTLDSIKAFTDLNRHACLGIALAPYHIQKNGESVERAIRAAGRQLRFFYAWQHGQGTQQLPGIGPTDFTPWLKALAEVDYQGFVNPFMHHEPEPDEMDDALRTSRDYLLKIAASL
jgi:sugar phosphate isomerase/epimerase